MKLIPSPYPTNSPISHLNIRQTPKTTGRGNRETKAKEETPQKWPQTHHSRAPINHPNLASAPSAPPPALTLTATIPAELGAAANALLKTSTTPSGAHATTSDAESVRLRTKAVRSPASPREERL